MNRYLAIDPGRTSGVAALDDKDVYRANQIEHDVYDFPHVAFLDFLGYTKPEHIIYEPFHFRQNQLGAVFDGVEYIGIIKLYAQRENIPLTEITPADGKAFWNDKKIRQLKLWVPGLKHGMDALRILLTYRMKHEDGFRKKILQELK